MGFPQDGFVNGGPVLDVAEIDELRAELERVIADQGRAGVPQPLLIQNLNRSDGARPIWQVTNIWQASDAYRRLLSHPVLVARVAELLGGDEIRVWHDQIQYKPASHGGTNPWHQDWPYWPVLSEPAQLTAWIALDDADESNGCMSMVPGSHQWGVQLPWLRALGGFEMPPEFEGHALRPRPCPVRAGHVHFHHALTWHGSMANTSGRPRRAIAIHYMNERTRYVASRDHIVKPLITNADGEVLSGEAFPLVYSARASTNA